MLATPLPHTSATPTLRAPGAPPTVKPLLPQGTTRPSRRSVDNHEDHKLLVLLSLMLLTLALPAVLTLTYMILNPETFQRDLTPPFDFSSWQPGAPVAPIEATTTP